MQLYKNRGFSAMFQDTFSFLKRNGGHFFKHFFVVNGIFVLILILVGYFFLKLYTELVFGSFGAVNSNPVDQFMNENGILFFVLAIVFLGLALLSGIISYAYTPIYLQLYHKNASSKQFSTKAIVNVYKSNIGNLIIFLFSAILVGIPLIVVFGILTFVLAITIVGWLLLPLLIAGFVLFYTMTLMEYIEGKKGIWQCYGYSWKLLTTKFWASLGCVAIFYFMAYMIQNIPSIIIYVVGILKMVAGLESGSMDNTEFSEAVTTLMMAMFVLSSLLGIVLNVIVQLNQGIVFYSLKEENENIETRSSIDEIGKSN